MKPTRQHIIEYLQAKGVASVSELSYALHLTTANIRHHLSILQDEGVVLVVSQLPSKGRGHPVLLYGLTQKIIQHNLDRLSDALLKVLIQSSSPEARPAIFRELANQINGESKTTRLNPSQRLYKAIILLNQMNYQARWEAHSDAPRVILAHCPYAAILPQHPELCQLDSVLLDEMSGLPATQTAKLELNPQGIPQCVFVIGKR